MGRQREKYIDIVKALGIICVCIGHSETNWFLLYTISMFWMPVFYFVSGYLYNDYYSDHPFIRLKKGFFSYYVVFMLYDLGYLLFHNVFAALHLVNEENGEGFYTAQEYVSHFFDVLITGHREYFSGALWFLIAIFLITTGFAFENFFIKKLKLDKHRILIMIVIAIICLCFSKLDIHVVVKRACNGVFFFTFGYLYHLYDWNKLLLKYKTILSLSAVVTLTSIALLRVNGFYEDVYYTLLPVIFGGILGICLILIISQLEVIQKITILPKIGKCTLEIMALHFLAFKLVSLIIVLVYDLPIERLADYPAIKIGGLWWVVYTIVGVMVPYLIKCGVVKIKAKYKMSKTK